MKITYEIIRRENLTNEHRKELGKALEKQNKVIGDKYQKADRCKLICFAKIGNKVVGTGGIKIKMELTFSEQKANLPELNEQFEWELGYLYTSERYRRKGIISQIVSHLIEKHGEGNLMATTEVKENPAMVKTLEKNGFLRNGSTWKSKIHGNDLGLYLKYA